MKKLLQYILVFLFIFNIFCMTTNALGISDNLLIMDTSCNEVLGSPDDPESTYTLLQQIFTLMKLAAPALVLVFSVIEFVKSVASQDKDLLQKAIKHTLIRFIAGLAVFVIPILFDFVFEILGWYGTCGIS